MGDRHLNFHEIRDNLTHRPLGIDSGPGRRPLHFALVTSSMEKTSVARLDSLTSLRFLAALLVFGAHADRQLNEHIQTLLIRAPLFSGSLGVSFFYLLSGFVLTWSLRPDDTARSFYWRRFGRIYPSHFVVWVGTLALLLTVFHEKQDVGTILPSLTLTQAWWPDAHVIRGVNGVAWSLSAEFFFYACFPLVVRGVRALGHRRLLLMAALVALVVGVDVLIAMTVDLESLSDPRSVLDWLVYNSPAFRVTEFVLGVCLAQEFIEGRRVKIGLAPAIALVGVGLYVAGLTRHAHLCVGLTLIPFMLVISAAAGRDVAGKPTLLHRRFFVRLGEWSFAFYLVHQLVLRLGAKLQVDSIAMMLAWLAVQFCFALAAAAALHYLVERPAERRIRLRLAARRAEPVAV